MLKTISFVLAFILVLTGSAGAKTPSKSKKAIMPAGSDDIEFISSPLTTSPTYPIRVEPNTRYFNYGNKTVALIGISGEFLPQVNWLKKLPTLQQPVPPATNKSKENCGVQMIIGDQGFKVEKYKNCIDVLKAAGLNVMRIWVGLNHSPGKGDPTTFVGPYRNEQPVPYDGSKWNMNMDVEGDWDTVYEQNLYDVVQYAQGKGVIVELTLFEPNPQVDNDPLTPDLSGPWKKAFHTMNTGSTCGTAPNTTQNVEFTNDLMFVRGDKNFDFISPTNPVFPAGDTESKLDAVRIDDVCENIKTRTYQAKLVKRMVKLLNGKLYTGMRSNRLHNFYWELANEPDGNGAGIKNNRNWHYYMAWLVRNYEKITMPNLPVHLIAVNYELKPLFDELLSNVKAKDYIDIVAAHYVKKVNVSTKLAEVRLFDPSVTVNPPSTPAYGAISMIRTYGGAVSGANNKIWAFNEGRVTGIAFNKDTYKNPTVPASARAEAWEFMLSGGAVYDHYGFNWGNGSANADAPGARGTRLDLKRLAGILINNAVDLKSMKRSQSWLASGVPGYDQPLTRGAGNPPLPSPIPNTYYAAMNNVDTFFYYRHNSLYSNNPDAPKYEPVYSTNAYRERVKFRNPYQCKARFSAEWIRPRAGQKDFRYDPLQTTPDPIFIQDPDPTIAIPDFELAKDAVSAEMISSFYNYDIALKIKKISFPNGCSDPNPTTMTNSASSANNAATATASSELSEDYPASSVIDGDRSGNNWGHSGGWADATSGDYPDWVQLTYERSQPITEVDIFTLRDNYTDEAEVTEDDKFSLYGAMDLELQYRDPLTQDWVTIPNGIVVGNDKAWIRFTFEPIFTDAIRVVVNRGAGFESPADDYSRIVEIETYYNEDTKGGDPTF